MVNVVRGEGREGAYCEEVRHHWGQRSRDGLQSEQRGDPTTPSHPFLDDVKSVCSCCKAPHLEGALGWLTCQLVTPVCFAFRWLWRPPADDEGFLPVTQPAVDTALGRTAGRGGETAV